MIKPALSLALAAAAAAPSHADQVLFGVFHDVAIVREQVRLRAEGDRATLAYLRAENGLLNPPAEFQALAKAAYAEASGASEAEARAFAAAYVASQRAALAARAQALLAAVNAAASIPDDLAARDAAQAAHLRVMELREDAMRWRGMPYAILAASEATARAKHLAGMRLIAQGDYKGAFAVYRAL